jgi:hypothetical protein
MKRVSVYRIVIEYPDGQTKIEVPYKDEDQKAWINVEAYQICLKDDRDLSREAGQLPEQQLNATAAKEAEEALKRMMPITMETCIEQENIALDHTLFL